MRNMGHQLTTLQSYQPRNNNFLPFSNLHYHRLLYIHESITRRHKIIINIKITAKKSYKIIQLQGHGKAKVDGVPQTNKFSVHHCSKSNVLSRLQGKVRSFTAEINWGHTHIQNISFQHCTRISFQ